MEPEQRILIVDDDTEVSELLYRKILNEAGYQHIDVIGSIEDLMDCLNASLSPENQSVDLILMDVVLPEKDGIIGLQTVKQYEHFRDIPILMLTAVQDKQLLKQAFEAGAMDYITKPVDHVELHARVGSALRLKQEIDRRKAWENELLEMTRGLMESNARLEQASFVDPVTGLLNRKAFDKRLQDDWIQTYVQKGQIGLMLIEVDQFKAYNDRKGGVQGDLCLQEVAAALKAQLSAHGQLYRFGGAMFTLVSPMVEEEEFHALAQSCQQAVLDLELDHPETPSGQVEIRTGVACMRPSEAPSSTYLMEQADLDLAQSRID